MAEVKVKDVQKTSQDIINGLTTKGLKNGTIRPRKNR